MNRFILVTLLLLAGSIPCVSQIPEGFEPAFEEIEENEIKEIDNTNSLRVSKIFDNCISLRQFIFFSCNIERFSISNRNTPYSLSCMTRLTKEPKEIDGKYLQ